MFNLISQLLGDDMVLEDLFCGQKIWLILHTNLKKAEKWSVTVWIWFGKWNFLNPDLQVSILADWVLTLCFIFFFELIFGYSKCRPLSFLVLTFAAGLHFEIWCRSLLFLVSTLAAGLHSKIWCRPLLFLVLTLAVGLHIEFWYRPLLFWCRPLQLEHLGILNFTLVLTLAVLVSTRRPILSMDRVLQTIANLMLWRVKNHWKITLLESYIF